MIYSQPSYKLKQSIWGYSALPPNDIDDWFWLMGWGSHGKCTSVYNYTLNKTYDESWHKTIK